MSVSLHSLTTNGIAESRLNVVDVISGKAETLQPDDRIVFLQHQNKLFLNRSKEIMPTIATVLYLRQKKLLSHEGLHMCYTIYTLTTKDIQTGHIEWKEHPSRS